MAAGDALQTGMSAQAAQESVLATCLRLAGEGFLPGTGGNVALRISPKLFAITPSASDYFALSPRDICVVELDTLRMVEGTAKPSVETGLHARLLRARPDLNASIHTHQPVASAVALLRREIPVADPIARNSLGPSVPVVGYAPSGTWFLARAFGHAVRPEINAYLLANHGIVCGGATMEEAIDRVRLLENLAAKYLAGEIEGHRRGDRATAFEQTLLARLRGINDERAALHGDTA